MFFKISAPNNFHRSTEKHQYRSKEHTRATASEWGITQKHFIVLQRMKAVLTRGQPWVLSCYKFGKENKFFLTF